MFDGIPCNLDRIHDTLFGIYGNIDLSTDNLQLFNSGRAIYVTSHQQRMAALFAFQHIGQLARKSGFTGPLKTRHEDDRRGSFEIYVGVLSSHQQSQFIMNQLDHHLARLDSVKDIHPKCLVLYRISESFGNLIIYVGIQQCLANIFQCFCNIDLGNSTLTF